MKILLQGGFFVIAKTVRVTFPDGFFLAGMHS